jgi:outer membrane protein TolC
MQARGLAWGEFMAMLRFVLGACVGAALLVLLSPPLASAAVPAGPVNVDETVTIALHNPTVTKAEQDVQIAQEQAQGAGAAREPNVNLSVTSVYNPNPASVTIPGAGGGAGTTFQIGRELTDTLNLSGSIPLWPRERWRAPMAAAEANVGATTESLNRTRQTVTYLTRQSFYQLLSAEELLVVAESAVKVAEKQLKLAEDTVAAGVAAPLDVYQARAVLADARVNLAKAQNAVELSRSSLAVQMGLPAATPVTIIPPGGPLPTPPPLDPAVATALRIRPEIAQLGYRRQQQEASIEAIKLQQRASVTLSANYAKPLDPGPSGLGSSGLSVTAAVGWNLYNGGKTNAELAAARIQLAEIDTTQRQVELGIGLEVRQAWLSLDNANKQLTAATEQERAAREALRIAELRYREGEGILLEVEQARLKLTQAQTAVAQARLQAFTAEAQLRYAVGVPAP